jgi:O-methyltransferase involved in polyketide biosynthesis
MTIDRGDRTVRPDLGEVQETLLIPLYARAVETAKPDGVLHDPRAVEMVRAIDYDFGRFDDIGSLAGANLRTLVFDDWVARFLDASPGGTVVEIGTGLNTRFERVDNGAVHWFDLDLPDAIELRRAFFTDDDRRRMLAASVLDPGWVDVVRTAPEPYFVVAEAVLAFLDEDEVRRVFDLLADRLPGCELTADTSGGPMVEDQDSPDVLGTVAARMRWRCDDPAVPETWDPRVRLVESIDFGTLPRSVWSRLPPAYQEGMRSYIASNPERSAAYRINRYRVG